MMLLLGKTSKSKRMIVEDVDIDIQQHIELKYVSCGGGHLAIVSFCQEHKPGEVVD